MSAVLRRLAEIHPALRDARVGRGLTLALSYAAWLTGYRLLIVSFVTYFVFSTSQTGGAPRLEDVNEALGTNALWIAGLGALLFVAGLKLFNPWRAAANAGTPHLGLERSSPTSRGIAQGAILALAIVGACLAGGIYRYLGFFVHFEEALLAAGNVMLRAASLGVMVYAEEYLFRARILPLLLSPSERPGVEPGAKLGWELAAAVLCTLLYTGIKAWQFDLGLMQSATLALFSLALSFRAIESRGEWKEGAALFATILILFHPLLGIPIFGSEFGGVFLVKYQPYTEPTEFLRLLSGGAGGPLSGFALQILLIFDMIRIGLRRASLLNPNPSENRDA